MAGVLRREGGSRNPGAPAPPAPAGSSSGVRPSFRADRAADAALLAGYGLGDPSAAAAFVRRFQGAVFGHALSVTHDHALAEDVAQEAFARAWKAAATYDAALASVSTWLLTISRNTAIDAVRARRSTPVPPHLLEEVVREAFSTSEPSETAVHRVDSVRALKDLAELHPNQARAVALAVLAGCTAAEVGEHENIPLGTAKTRIRTGLMRLRAAAHA